MVDKICILMKKKVLCSISTNCFHAPGYYFYILRLINKYTNNCGVLKMNYTFLPNIFNEFEGWKYMV